MMLASPWVAWLFCAQPVESDAPSEPVAEVQPEDPITVERGDGAASTPALEETLRKTVAGRFTPPCTIEPCDPTAGARLHVSVSERERDYDAVVSVTRADGSRSEATVKCTICTSREAGKKIGAKAIELLDGEADDAHIQVMSSPAGATIEIDGAVVGQTPMRVEVAPGSHRVVIRKQGHVAQERQVELVAGSEDVVRVELPRDRSRQHRAMRIAGWTAIGVGVAGIVTGIALIATDENPVKNNCSGVHVDRFGNCEFRWNTLGAGVGLLVPGIIAAGAGTALVVIGRKNERSSARARLQIGPGRIAIAGRF